MSVRASRWQWILSVVVVVGCEEGRIARVPPVVDNKPAPQATTTITDTEPVAPPAMGPYGKTDAQRIEDVHAIVRGIEEYRRRTGRLPFDETFETLPEGAAPAPINVNLANGPLPEEFREPPPGVPGAVVAGDEFIEYLQRTLGQGFTLPSDPAPAPRFYQVHFDGRDYYVSAALFEASEHTMPLADDWHKYQVGSRPDVEKRVRAVEEALDR
jgi:hypothetical protein